MADPFTDPYVRGARIRELTPEKIDFHLDLLETEHAPSIESAAIAAYTKVTEPHDEGEHTLANAFLFYEGLRGVPPGTYPLPDGDIFNCPIWQPV